MRILLTGFGPFGEVVDNPSGRIVEHFAREGIDGHDLTAVVLPVSYRSVRKEIPRLIRSGPPDLAVLLGVAAKAEEIRLERWATNRAAGADVEGIGRRDRPILRGGPERYRTHLSLNSVKRALSAIEAPAVISNSAGRYLCNYAYYGALHIIATHVLTTRCLFVHLPPDNLTFGTPPKRTILDFGSQVGAVRTLLTSLVLHTARTSMERRHL